MATLVQDAAAARPKRTIAEVARAAASKKAEKDQSDASEEDENSEDDYSEAEDSVVEIAQPAKKQAGTPVKNAVATPASKSAAIATPASKSAATPNAAQTPSGTPFLAGKPVARPLPSTPSVASAAPASAAPSKKPRVPKGAPAPLDKLLAPLDSATLCTLLQRVCDRSLADQATQSNEQFLRQELGGSSSLSKAAMANRLEEAAAAMKKISRAFPHTRWGSSTDRYSYNRVRPTQAEAIRILLEPLGELKEAKNDAALLEYLLGAIWLADQLPDWDDPKHNKPRENCYKRLAAALKPALKSPAGKALTQAERAAWLVEVNKLVPSVSNFAHLQAVEKAAKANLPPPPAPVVPAHPFTDCVALLKGGK